SNLDKNVLGTIANATSAQAIFVPSVDQVTQIFRNVSEQLHTQYIFSYTSKIPADNHQHDVSVSAKFNGDQTKITATFIAKPPALKFDVSGIADKSTVSGSQSVEAKITTGTAKQADLLVDGNVVSTATAAPYKLPWEAGRFTEGQHTVIVRVTDSLGTPVDQTFIVTIQGAAPTVAPTAAATAAATAVTAAPTPTPATAGSSTNWIPYAAGGVGVLLLAGAGAFVLTRRKPSVTLPPVPAIPTAKPEPIREDRTEVIPRTPIVTPPPTPKVNSTPPVQQPVADALEATAVVESGQTIVAGQDAGATVVRQPALPRARLHVVQSGGESDANLSTAETILGRDPTNPVVVRDPLASRRHARIIVENGEFWLEDMKSLNGTRVNGEVITGRRKLLPNDQIKIGEVTMTFLPVN
ncbi:MAG TPA: FHA domain-containing protein, partial [Chloroflexota bacterium]|nr:FHA domain-containing protein [Chloroflexota bacterium]